MILKPISASILAFNLFILNLQSEAQTLSLENCREICCDSLFFTKPVWNADGNSLLLTGEHNRNLYLLNLHKHQLSCLKKNIKIKGKPIWSKTGHIIFLIGNDVEIIDQFKSTVSKAKDTILIVNTRKQKIEAVCLSSNATWDITPETALYYNSILSPDGKLAVIHLQSEILLYATDGSGLIRKLGTGMASSWSPDSKYVFYFLDESSDGHSISNSEIYVLSSDGQFKQKITETTEFCEMWPAISPDGKHVAFADEKTGRIFIADLKITGE